MAQTLKEEVRARILTAALETFAEQGFAGATMPVIAARAGVAPANLYRYFANKAELFRAVAPDGLAKQLDALLARRVSTLSHLAGASAPPSAPSTDAAAEELLAFWTEHRLLTVILLERAAGTPHERWGERFVARLVEETLAQLQRAHPGLRIATPERLVLTTLFENTRHMLAVILEKSRTERAIREAVAAFWAYQLAGLAGFSRWVARPGRAGRAGRQGD